VVQRKAREPTSLMYPVDGQTPRVRSRDRFVRVDGAIILYSSLRVRRAPRGGLGSIRARDISREAFPSRDREELCAPSASYGAWMSPRPPEASTTLRYAYAKENDASPVARRSARRFPAPLARTRTLISHYTCDIRLYITL
jgi:hypothetical protein